MPTSLLQRIELADLLPNLREGVQIIGVDWRYLFLNEPALVHAGQPAEALLGRRVMECYPGIENTELFRMLERVMDTEKPESMCNQFEFPDGHTGWFEVRAQSVPPGILVLTLDVSTQRAMELNLRRAVRLEALGRLAGGIAHDFNNILTVIGCCTASLAETITDPETAREVKRVDGAVKRATRLTGRLLDFAREKPIAPVPVDASSIARNLLSLAKITLGSGIEIEFQDEPHTSSVLIDPASLEQVILNLFLNARDAMGGQGALAVRVSEVKVSMASDAYQRLLLPPNSYVVIAVSDTGCGIASRALEHIFDPFFSTKGERGTGLGLATSHGLVTQAGGAIDVHSEVGCGATFEVYLPAAGPPLPQATSTSAPPRFTRIIDRTRAATPLGVQPSTPELLRARAR